MLNKNYSFKMLFILIALSSLSFADEKGMEVAKRMEKANEGYQSEKASIEMVLLDAHGTKTIRKMERALLEVQGDADKSIMTFLTPNDIKGTKMLTHGHKDKNDEQWLYLPSTKKVKRINGRGRQSSFMGSEFTFEDLGSQDPEKYDFKLLSEDKEQWVLERRPKEESGYSKQIAYNSKKYHSPIKVEYFDRQEKLLKVATFSDFQSYQVGQKTLWRPNSVTMKNVQTRKESVLKWENREVGVSIPTNLFNSNTLTR